MTGWWLVVQQQQQQLGAGHLNQNAPSERGCRMGDTSEALEYVLTNERTGPGTQPAIKQGGRGVGNQASAPAQQR